MDPAAQIRRKLGSPGRGRSRLAQGIGLSAALLIGLLLRTAYLRELAGTPDFSVPLADAAFHDYWARGLVTGDWTPPSGCDDPRIGSSPYLRPPGYPYFLAFLYWAFGPGNYLAVRVAQMALGLVSVGLGYALARSLFGHRAALICALLLSVHWAFIYYEGELQEPFLLVLLALSALLLLQRWARRATVLRGLAAGLLLGLMALVRPNALAFVPVASLWMFWALRRRAGLSQSVRSAGALLLGAALAVVPATIRNYVVSRDLVLISGNGAINLYIGNNPLSDGYTARIPELRAWTGQTVWSWFIYNRIVRAVEAEVGRPLKHSEVSAYFRDRAWRYMCQNPGHCLALAVKRLLLLLGPAEVANNKEVHFERRFSAILRFLPGFSLALASGVLGLAMLARQRWGKSPTGLPAAGGPPVDVQFHLLVLLFVAVYLASFVPFLAAERFRVPIVPFLLLYGGYGMGRLWDLARAREFRRLIVWGLAGTALFAAAQIRWTRYEPHLAVWHLGRGEAYLLRGDRPRAIEEYYRAVSAEPGYVAARRSLAAVLVQAGRLDEAIDQYRAVVGQTPEDPDAYHALGGVLAERGLFEQAEAAYRTAQRLDPQSPGPHLNLGNLYLEWGRADLAAAQYVRALELQHNLAEAHYGLGRAYQAQHDLNRAEAAYQAAVQANPAFVEARINLGTVLAERQQFEAAIEQYEHVLAIDSQRFEAHYNLAAALAALGRTEQAIAAVKHALAIQPENAAARQMLRTLQARSGKPPG